MPSLAEAGAARQPRRQQDVRELVSERASVVSGSYRYFLCCWVFGLSFGGSNLCELHGRSN